MVPTAPAIEDRHNRILAELADLGLVLARDLQARALAAESPQEAAQLSAAFHNISRGVRQTLALELKVARFRADLAREAASAAAEAARQHERVHAPVIRARISDVAREVEKLIWCEPEDEDEEFDEARAEALQERLNQWLALASERPDFISANVDELIIQACDTVGLDPGRLYVFEDEEEDSEEVEYDAAPAPNRARGQDPDDTG